MSVFFRVLLIVRLRQVAVEIPQSNLLGSLPCKNHADLQRANQRPQDFLFLWPVGLWVRHLPAPLSRVQTSLRQLILVDCFIRPLTTEVACWSSKATIIQRCCWRRRRSSFR